MKNEYMEFARNTLIVANQNGEWKFIAIIKGKVFDVTSNVENETIKMLLATHQFSVIDDYGKELLIHNYDELIEFYNAVNSFRKNFNFCLDRYHSYMDELHKLRKYRTETANCFINDDYNRLVDLLDELVKETSEVLYQLYNAEEAKILEKYIHKPSEDEKLCVLFGLYIAVLRAYICNYDYENSSMTLDEKIRNKFQKEFNYFIADRDCIIEKYAKYFALKQIEIDEIRQLLKDAGIDGGEWITEEAELTLL
ncbi:MAG: hypothetical protein IKV81_01965 [Clostridia bacterium]|nr:hypothetical protein [Clostridia bacterium]